MRPSTLGRTLVVAAGVAFAMALSAPVIKGQGPKPPDTVVLKGAPMGGVKLEHKLHATDRKNDCKTCHHASKPQKALKGDFQSCTDCHTKAATAPMKTNTRDAFHDAMAKKGVCIDCHAAENAKGKKAPMKCNECHKKENG